MAELAWRWPPTSSRWCAVVTLAMVAACGRVDFDPVPPLAAIRSGGAANGSGALVDSVMLPAFDAGSGPYRALVVGLAFNVHAAVAPTGLAITFAGRPLQRLSLPPDNEIYATMWLDASPPAGRGDLIATWTNNVDAAALAAVVLAGVDPIAPITGGASIDGEANPSSVSVASAPGHLTFDLVAMEAKTEQTCGDGSRQVLCPIDGEVQLLYDESSPLIHEASGISQGSDTATASWSLTSSSLPWAHAIVDVAPAARRAP